MIEYRKGWTKKDKDIVRLHRPTDRHQRQHIKEWITTNGFANSIVQTDSESSILQLGEHVARDLGLRFRASPPHSHQSNGAVERLYIGRCLTN